MKLLNGHEVPEEYRVCNLSEALIKAESYGRKYTILKQFSIDCYRGSVGLKEYMSGHINKKTCNTHRGKLLLGVACLPKCQSCVAVLFEKVKPLAR